MLDKERSCVCSVLGELCSYCVCFVTHPDGCCLAATFLPSQYRNIPALAMASRTAEPKGC
jgi:hypothetical protein